MRRFPRIGFREEGPRRRARIDGTRIDVWWVIDTLRDGSRDYLVDLLEEMHRSSYDIDAVMAYYECFADEIDPLFKEAHQPV